MSDARNAADTADRYACADAPERALRALWNALRDATLALGEQALRQHSEAALRADAVLAAGVSRLKRRLSPAPLSAADDGPHAPEATMTESTDNDDAGVAPNAHRDTPPPAGAPPRADADAPLEPEELLERLRAALAGHGGGEPYQYTGLHQQIESALKQSNEAVLGAAGEFAYGHRAATDAFAAGLRKVSDAQHRQNLQTLQAAALAVCLDAMLKRPEQAEEYAGLLEAIKHIV